MKFPESSPTTNEDKKAWCQKGLNDENEFRLVALDYPDLADLIVHPDKARNNYATDFKWRNIGVDLKSVREPFFTASKYGMDAQFTVTFNHKDYIRYMHQYPEWSNEPMIILFWVIFEPALEYGARVAGLSGVWSIRLHTIDSWIRHGEVHCHSYQKREGETGTNAKHSWLIDLRRCNELKKK